MNRSAVMNSLLISFFPFLKWKKLITRRTLHDDFFAGITGAIIVLPQGVAFAIIAGLPPEFGLYTAIVVPIVAGLFGSSLHLVSGPTTAISIVVLGVVSSFAVPGSPQFIGYVLTITFMAGVFQFALGLARMGTLVNFISHTVVIGFTTGASLLIAGSQLGGFFGIILPRGESIVHTLWELISNIGDANFYIALVAFVSLITTMAVKRFRPRWPNMLLGMLAGALITFVINGEEHGVPLLGSLPGMLPPISMPDFSLNNVRQLSSGAFAIALLGLIEAVSIGRAVATRSHQRIDGNQEFIGQGLSNMVGSFFSSYAASGSFTRTGINYDAGARTPLSAIFASAIVALVVVFLAPVTAYLPMPALSGIIMLVAYNLIDFKTIRLIVKSSKRETAVLTTTFVATLFVALEFAIYIGVMLSLILYLQRTSHPAIISMAPDSTSEKRSLADVTLQKSPECPQMKIVRIDGSLFFGAVDHVQTVLADLADQDAEWKHVLIIAEGINFIDVAGTEMLVHEGDRLRQAGGGLYLCNLKEGVEEVLKRGPYWEVIGAHNVYESRRQAISAVFDNLDKDRCAICARRIFRECASVEYEGGGMLS